MYEELDIAHSVVMGNRSLEWSYHDYPADMFHYCVGLDRSLMAEGNVVQSNLAEKVEENLRRANCCGVKLYPGYNKLSISDKIYEPIYELAARYDKPVAVHMGLTSQAQAHLKYCHPMELDEVAADHPEILLLEL